MDARKETLNERESRPSNATQEKGSDAIEGQGKTTQRPGGLKDKKSEIVLKGDGENKGDEQEKEKEKEKEKERENLLWLQFPAEERIKMTTPKENNAIMGSQQQKYVRELGAGFDSFLKILTQQRHDLYLKQWGPPHQQDHQLEKSKS